MPDAVLDTGGRTTLLPSETIRFSGENWQFTNNQTGKIKKGEEFSDRVSGMQRNGYVRQCSFSKLPGEVNGT